MEGLNIGIGLWVVPEDIKQSEDRQVQIKADGCWAEEEVKL